jgi:hypothetical protein
MNVQGAVDEDGALSIGDGGVSLQRAASVVKHQCRAGKFIGAAAFCGTAPVGLRYSRSGQCGSGSQSFKCAIRTKSVPALDLGRGIAHYGADLLPE